MTEKMYLRSCNQEVRSRAVSSFPSLSPLRMKSWSLALSAEELCPICERDKKTSHLGGSYMKKRTRRAERKVRPGVIRRPHLVWLKKKMTNFFLRNLRMTSTLREPHQEQSQDHFQREWLGVGCTIIHFSLLSHPCRKDHRQEIVSRL